MCSAASSALEAVLAHAEPGQCLPLLQREMQAGEQLDNADAAHALQACLPCIMTCIQDACSHPSGLSIRVTTRSGAWMYHGSSSIFSVLVGLFKAELW